MRRSYLVIISILIAIIPCGAFAQTPPSLFRVGAAKIDITPTQLRKNIEGFLGLIAELKR